MNSTSATPPKCQQCGASLAADAPEGLCGRCLARLFLSRDSVVTSAEAFAAEPPTPAEIAPCFPQLEVLACLGRGGMGVVYKARQKSLDRFVALKILAPEREKDPQFAERFAREAQALARLNHPHIVTIYDFGQTDGLFFLLMEFVDGLNLRELLRTGRLEPPAALAIVPPICEALQYAHDRGVVHRDIKPENLLLDKAGQIKIADFGIAKLLGSDAPIDHAQCAGTPAYMAPEQSAAAEAVDHRADIYSLGVVLYEMLTGELPSAQFEAPSRKVQIDVRLDEIVLRALEYEPKLRFQQASHLRTAVETVANTRPAPGARSAKGDSPQGVLPLAKKNWISIALASLFLAAALGLFYQFKNHPNRVQAGSTSAAPDPLLQKSPFSDVRWQQSEPEVQVGDEWFKLMSLDELPVAEILAFSRQAYGRLWQKRFEEDLVDLLTGMGHPPRDTVTLVLQSLTSPETRTLENVAMTKENRWAIKKAVVARWLGQQKQPAGDAIPTDEPPKP